MKLATYRHNESTSCGIVTERGIVDIPSTWTEPNPPKNILEILQRGSACLDQLRSLVAPGPVTVPLDSVTLLAPLPRPGKLLALAGNYAAHVKEAANERGFKVGLSESPRQTTVPRPFLMPPTVVCGPGETIAWPAYSEQIDYEIELAVVIGKQVKGIDAREATSCIAGYTIVNDVSARSVTFKQGRAERPWDDFYDWLNGKWADGFLPMGPYLVTQDEIDDAQDLDLMLKVNGQTRQSANTSQMIYSVAEIISFCSHLMTLEPGDIIATGTPSGVGLATGNFLKAGDTIECTIEGLGTLHNTLGPRPERFYQPLAT